MIERNLNLDELRHGLDSKQFSSRELTESLISAAEKNSSLGCYLELSSDSALREAEEADKKLASGVRTPLLGIPLAIKDAILTKGLRTTTGSKILHNFVPPYDATCVAKLKSAGAIIIGKTNLDEFAMGSSNENSAYGPVKNPWASDRVPGGSSGGSAASVSSRLVPAALGTDTGGSIRQPASYCGIVGLKPTYGRVSRYGVVAYASSLDQVGAFSRTVKDCAVVTEIISGKDPYDSTSVEREVPKFTEAVRREVKGLRVGVPKEYFVKGLSPEVEGAVRGAIKKLEELGAKVVEISLPHTELALASYYIIAPAEASSNLSRYDGVRFGHRATGSADLADLYSRSRSEGFGKEVKRRILIGTYVLSKGYYDAYYLKAQRVRRLIANDFHSAFEKSCDLIACPTAPTTAFKLGEKTTDPIEMYLNDIFTIPVNLAGLPAMSIPCGFDGAGLPIGLQLIGRPWDEETLFAAAGAYESATEWQVRMPPGMV